MYIAVKFDSTNKSYTFKADGFVVSAGDKVVVETARGLEIGKVIGSPFDKPNIDLEIKEIIRVADKKDLELYNSNKESAQKAKLIAQEEADKLNLGMNIIASEYTLDRAKITFAYLADDRVDFRELLKVLASRFHCRIDLRQIGTRDKAKMVSGLGCCGRELCCAKFISDFDRISINMAKNQLLALNIQKLSGQCGNLMCCLKYEDEAYKELRKDLPKLNATVEFEGAKYKLTSMNVINDSCRIENAETSLNVSLKEFKKKAKYNLNKKEGEKGSVK